MEGCKYGNICIHLIFDKQYTVGMLTASSLLHEKEDQWGIIKFRQYPDIEPIHYTTNRDGIVCVPLEECDTFTRYKDKYVLSVDKREFSTNRIDYVFHVHES